MRCNTKIKNTCGSTINSSCVDYEPELPEISKLTDDCATVEETITDLYVIVEELKEDSNFEDFTSNCLVYENKELKTIIIKQDEEICLLKEKVAILEESLICNYNITDCLDVSTLIGQCETPITTLGDLLEYILNKIE